MKWNSFAGVIAVILLFGASPAIAESRRVSAYQIPNIEPVMVNSKGTLVGYDDNDLISIELNGTKKRLLIPDIRYKIDLLQLTNKGEVIYSEDEGEVQIVRSIPSNKNQSTREIFRREKEYSRILANRVGDVAVIERADSGDSLVIYTHERRKKRLALPNYYDLLYLSDDRVAIGVVTSYNEKRNANERRLVFQDFSKKKLVTVKSRVIDRSIHSIVYGAASGKVYGLAYPVDGDETTDAYSLFMLRFPGNKFSIYSTLEEGEELQGLWQGFFSVLAPYSQEVQQESRLVGKGVSPRLSCSGLTGVTLKFEDSFATENIALAEIHGADAENRYRAETVVLVPAKNKLGLRKAAHFSCRLN